MKFVPKLYDRTKGDFVSSERMNQDARDLYADITELFEREMTLLAKSKMLSDAIGAISYGYMEATKNLVTLPEINTEGNFFFPEGVDALVVDRLYNEFVLPTDTERDEILDVGGKAKETISIERSSDNLIFSKKPSAVTESSPRFAVEKSDFPYMVRVVGSTEPVYVRLDVKSFVEPMVVNVIEFVPFPYVGGTELIDVKLASEDIGSVPLEDVDKGPIIIRSADAYYRHRPMRLCIRENPLNTISFLTRGNALADATDTVIGGIFSVKAFNRVYKSSGYIGFAIQGTGTIKGIKPVFKWCNSYKGNVNTKVYASEAAARALSPSELTSFDSEGNGLSVDIDGTLYVVVEVKSEINATPQILGFEIIN